MKFKKIFIYSVLPLLLVSCNGKNDHSFNFHYSQAISNDYTMKAYYVDEYFENDSTIYNPSLATTSLCLAMSSFASNKEGSYDHKYCNVEDFFRVNSFHDIEVNSFYKEKPTSDSLGVCIAQKEINGETLIAVGIRGGGYEKEWASNFTLGLGEEIPQHQGFYEASTIYLESLEEYLKNHNISGSIKLWSVGYSRGGATNNLAIGRIDQKISSNLPIFDNVNISLKKEDIYAYCFEAPQGASWEEIVSPKDEIYSNIHNIVNPNDPVPMVAMSKMRFTRYGVDYYLPDIVRNSNYSEFNVKMLNNYNHVDNREALGDYLISDFSMRKNKDETLNIADTTYIRKNWTSGLFLNELLDNLTELGIVSRENYVNNIESGLRTIFEIIYNNGQTKFSLMNLGISLARTLVNDANIDIVVNNLFHDISAFETDMFYALKTAFDAMNIVEDPSSIISAIKSLVVALAKTLASHVDYFFTFLSIDNVKALAQGHYPEVCLSSLMALDTNYTTSVSSYSHDGSYYYLEVPNIDENTKIVIKNKDNKVVAGLNNGSLLSSGTLSYASMNKSFIAYIPSDEKYEISVENATSYNLSYFDQKYENLINVKSEELESNVSPNNLWVQ